MVEFVGFPKIPRFYREIVVTEKIDGTNASIYIGEDGTFKAGSRNRWIVPEADNYGFARWAYSNEAKLTELLGPGHHFGEWYGSGINRGYGMASKRFALFNASRWNAVTEPAKALGIPEVCVVPTLYHGPMSDTDIMRALTLLREHGSMIAPGYMNPEGVIVYHSASKSLYKITLDGDAHKGT